MNFGTRDARPVITMYVHDKDAIFLHTLNIHYKAELNFIIGDYENASSNTMDHWNSAIFVYEDIMYQYEEG